MSLWTSAARGAAGAAIALACVIGVATARVVALGGAAIADSDAAAARGDYGAAIARARDAAEAVAPGSSNARDGYARLETIARAAEARHDERTATAAWGAMRAATTATSSPFVATGAWRTLADDGLVRTGAAGPTTDPGEVHAPEATLRAALGHEDAAGPGALAVLGLGAVAALVVGVRIARGRG